MAWAGMQGCGQCGGREWGGRGVSLSAETSFWFPNCAPLSPGAVQRWSLSLALKGTCH